MMSESWQLKSEAEMIEAGRHLAQSLEAGNVIGLCGELGAGKTHFCQGVVAALGCDEPVSSPTFSLVNEYRSGSLPVFHFDFYRLDSPQELIAIGWDDYLDEEGVMLIEWANKFPEMLPEGSQMLHIEMGAGNERTIRVA